MRFRNLHRFITNSNSTGLQINNIKFSLHKIQDISNTHIYYYNDQALCTLEIIDEYHTKLLLSSTNHKIIQIMINMDYINGFSVNNIETEYNTGNYLHVYRYMSGDNLVEDDSITDDSITELIAVHINLITDVATNYCYSINYDCEQGYICKFIKKL